MRVVSTPMSGVRPDTDTQVPAGYGPADLRDAYDLPANGGAGRTIAVVSAYDNPKALHDLQTYRRQFGLPPLADGQFTKVNQRGSQTGYPLPSDGWAAESALSLDLVSAIAPNADIILVEADSLSIDDLGAGVNTAVELGAKYVVNNYGVWYDSDPANEYFGETAWDDAYYKHPGVAVVVGSGDYGYGLPYPAVSPYVTSVGGTSLVRDTSARGWSETVWRDASEGTGSGSGCSAYEPKPAFQQDVGCAHRTTADVSAVADPATGVAVYDSYGSGGGWGR